MFAVAASGLFLSVLAAQSNKSREYAVKAAMLFNFTKFVEWPESAFDNPQASIVFGIIGDQRLGFDLQRMASGEKVQGRSIVIRNMRFGDDLRGCHILLVGASERQHTAQILAGLQAVHVLTVSEIDGFADAGGAVEIVMEGDQARFVVNLDVARQRNLRVSAKVLAMARVINLNQAAK
jgi:hypothetical protein